MLRGSSLSQPTQYVAASEHNSENTSAAKGMLSGLACRPCAVTSSCPLLINTVLSFIKAYRLRGDTESKRVIHESFSTSKVETAKQPFWQFTKHDLELAGRSFHSRHDSDKYSQLAADLDDILQTFVTRSSRLPLCVYIHIHVYNYS